MIAAIPGIDDIALSTNALLLAEQAPALAAAGLRRVNVSLDTLHEDRFTAIARRPGLDRVLAGIDAAIAAGLGPVKINCVVMRGANDDELEAFAQMTRERAVHVRFIEVMPVTENVELQRDAWVSSDEVLERLAALGDLHPVPNPHGNGPARTFAYDDVPGTVGVISPLAHDYCERCNRVRLSADGRLKLCLFGDNMIDLRTPLRSGGGEEAIVDDPARVDARQARTPSPRARRNRVDDARLQRNRRLDYSIDFRKNASIRPCSGMMRNSSKPHDFACAIPRLSPICSKNVSVLTARLRAMFCTSVMSCVATPCGASVRVRSASTIATSMPFAASESAYPGGKRKTSCTVPSRPDASSATRISRRPACCSLSHFCTRCIHGSPVGVGPPTTPSATSRSASRGKA